MKKIRSRWERRLMRTTMTFLRVTTNKAVCFNELRTVVEVVMRQTVVPIRSDWSKLFLYLQILSLFPLQIFKKS